MWNIGLWSHKDEVRGLWFFGPAPIRKRQIVAKFTAAKELMEAQVDAVKADLAHRIACVKLMALIGRQYLRTSRLSNSTCCPAWWMGD